MNPSDLDGQTEHVFDQTNGVIAPESARPPRSTRAEIDRRRQQSSAQAYGMWAAGNQ